MAVYPADRMSIHMGEETRKKSDIKRSLLSVVGRSAGMTMKKEYNGTRDGKKQQNAD